MSLEKNNYNANIKSKTRVYIFPPINEAILIGSTLIVPDTVFQENMMNQKDANIDAGEKLRDEVAKTSESVKSEIESASQSAGKAARQLAEERYGEGKDVAEEHLGTMSSAVGEAAEKMEDENHPLASYANELSTQLGQLAGAIESKSLDDVAGDAHRLARDNPAMFMLGSVALGFAAARFIKASDSRDRANGKGRSHDSHSATHYSDSMSSGREQSQRGGRVDTNLGSGADNGTGSTAHSPSSGAMPSTAGISDSTVTNNPGNTL